jgi:hypothetical protein
MHEIKEFSKKKLVSKFELLPEHRDAISKKTISQISSEASKLSKQKKIYIVIFADK